MLFQTAKIGIDFLGGLFPDVTRVQNDKISAVSFVRRRIAKRGQNITHTLTVVHVHLAAIGFDKQAFGRRRRHWRAYATEPQEAPEGACLCVVVFKRHTIKLKAVIDELVAMLAGNFFLQAFDLFIVELDHLA